MSDEEDGDKKRFKRKPLTRSKRLGSRRRRGQEDEEEESTSEAGGEDAADEEPADEPIATQPVSATRIPPPPTASGQPNLAEATPPPGEVWAKTVGASRRFFSEFSGFVAGLGRSAQEQGQAFGRDVVKPFSQALFEAAICLSLLFVMALFGGFFGRYLKTATARVDKTVTFHNQVVRPGQKIDESLLSQGFNTEELHQQASRVLEHHFRALQEGEFSRAYQYLSPEWQSELPMESFEKGYRSTPVTAFRVGRAETIDAHKIRIRAQVQVEESGQERQYQAIYLMVLTRDGWKLDGGDFR